MNLAIPHDQAGPKHVPLLDGVRGVAILLAMMIHITQMDGRTAVDRLFGTIGHSGWCGVDLFFVLSGFLITGILYDAKGGRHYFRNFYARRILRIFPLYYLTLMFIFFALPHLYHQESGPMARSLAHRELYWLYLQNLTDIGTRSQATMGPQCLEIFWSLAIEEQFYLVWPAVVFLCDRRRLQQICLAAAAGAMVLRFYLYARGFTPLSIYMLTPARIDSLLIGGYVGLAMRGAEARAWRPWAGRLTLVAGGGLLVLILRCGALDYSDPWTLRVGFTLLAVFFGGILWLGLTAPAGARLPRTLGHPVLRMFGRYSYALYVLYPLVMATLHRVVPGFEELPVWGGTQLPAQAVFGVLVVASSLLVAFLSWNLYEKHFLALKRYFPAR